MHADRATVTQLVAVLKDRVATIERPSKQMQRQGDRLALLQLTGPPKAERNGLNDPPFHQQEGQCKPKIREVKVE